MLVMFVTTFGIVQSCVHDSRWKRATGTHMGNRETGRGALEGKVLGLRMDSERSDWSEEKQVDGTVERAGA